MEKQIYTTRFSSLESIVGIISSYEKIPKEVSNFYSKDGIIHLDIKYIAKLDITIMYEKFDGKLWFKISTNHKIIIEIIKIIIEIILGTIVIDKYIYINGLEVGIDLNGILEQDKTRVTNVIKTNKSFLIVVDTQIPEKPVYINFLLDFNIEKETGC